MTRRREFIGALLSAGCLAGCRGLDCATKPRALKMAEFTVYIAWAAKRRGVSEETIAREMVARGIVGMDAEYVEEERVRRLADAGMSLISLYGSVHFLDEVRGPREAEAFLTAAGRSRAPQLMVLPDDFPDGMDRAKAMDRITEGLASFTRLANREGFRVNIESFGSAANPCSRIRYMKPLFDGIPTLGFTLDTGNFFHAGNGAGDDILEAFRLFHGRIRHVHLKDRPADSPRGYAPLGHGVIPNEKIVRALVAEGFDGWFTFEEAGAEDIAQATYDAADVLRSWT